ncbi:hypothetical protein [Dongia sp.]|uniref:hypothetical protein n=1 Tax=Dongia sp. TaxID=1977262 RepID=UPI0035B31C80
MRKVQLLSAIALAALAAGCAQGGQSAASSECAALATDAFMQAVEEGRCDIDVTTAAGGVPEPKKSFEGHDGNDGGGEDDGDKEPGKEPDPEPDPDTDTDTDTGPSTAPTPAGDE